MKVVLWKDTFKQAEKEQEAAYDLYNKPLVFSLYLGSAYSSHLK